MISKEVSRTLSNICHGTFSQKSSKVFIHSLFSQKMLKDTHKGKAPSNKTPAFAKSINMVIWLVATSK